MPMVPCYSPLQSSPIQSTPRHHHVLHQAILSLASKSPPSGTNTITRTPPTNKQTKHHCCSSKPPRIANSSPQGPGVGCRLRTMVRNQLNKRVDIRHGVHHVIQATNPARNGAHLRQSRVNPLMVSKGPWPTQEAVKMGTMVLPQVRILSEIILDSMASPKNPDG